MPILGIKMPNMGSSTIIESFRPGRRKVADSRSSASTSLADALFTTTQQRLLALLFGQPTRSFYASEVIQRTGSGSGAVQRELKRLASSGLVTVKRIGNQRHYQANPESPVYHELRGLVRKTLAQAEPIRDALMSLGDRIKLALLFGSTAKGTDTATSDIDILIVADNTTLEEIYSALEEVETELDRKINPTLYTSQEFAYRKESMHPFLTRVLSGEHLVLLDTTHDQTREPSATR